MAESPQNDENGVALGEEQKELLPGETAAPTAEELAEQVGDLSELAPRVGRMLDLWDPTNSPAPFPGQKIEEKQRKKHVPGTSPAPLPKAESPAPLPGQKAQTTKQKHRPGESPAPLPKTDDQDTESWEDMETMYESSDFEDTVTDQTLSRVDPQDIEKWQDVEAIQTPQPEQLMQNEFPPHEKQIIIALSDYYHSSSQQRLIKHVFKEEGVELPIEEEETLIKKLSEALEKTDPLTEENIRETAKTVIAEHGAPITYSDFDGLATGLARIFVYKDKTLQQITETDTAEIVKQALSQHDISFQGEELKRLRERAEIVTRLIRQIENRTKVDYRTIQEKILLNGFTETTLASGQLATLLEHERRKVDAGGAGIIQDGFYAAIPREDKPAKIIAVILKAVKSSRLEKAFAHEKNIRRRIEIGLLDNPELKKLFARLISPEPFFEEHLGNTNLAKIIEQLKAPLLNEEREAKEKIVLKAMADAMEAIEWLHQQGIIHRDIKPANIMVVTDTNQKQRGVPIDVGISEHKDDEDYQSDQLKQGSAVGTTGYFDAGIYYNYDKEGNFKGPKGIDETKHNALDERTDLFAFAVMLFEQRLGISIKDLKKDITALGRAEIEKEQGGKSTTGGNFIFLANFEKYRTKLLEFSKGEPDPRLREIFSIVFARREDQAKMKDKSGSDWQEPTLKELKNLTRSLAA